jgi:TRAP-type C4-dicarboxylate transport system permease small subunit
MPPILRRLAALFAIIGGLAACLVAMLTVMSVVGRATISTPIPGDVELTQFGIALSIALCLPWCQLGGSNIIVDFFTQRASQATLGRLDGLGSVLLAAMVGVLAWRTTIGAFSVRNAHETTMILGLPMWWTYAVLAPGFALTALIALIQGHRRWRGLDVMVDPA